MREKRITVWRPAAQLLHSTIIQFPHTALHRRLIIPRARSSPYLCDKIPVILKQTSGFASFQHSFESSHAHDLNSESGNFSRQNQALEEGFSERSTPRLKTLKGGTKVNRFRTVGGQKRRPRMRDCHRLSKHLMYVDDFKLHQFPRKDGKGTQEEGK